MEQLGRVLFEVGAGDPDSPRLTIDVDREPAVDAERQVVLRDLVALEQVGIGVILAVELRRFGVLAVQGLAGHQRVLHRALVNDGEHPGQCEADGAHVGVGLGARVVGTAAAEHLALRLQLDVGLEPDDRLVVSGGLHGG